MWWKKVIFKNYFLAAIIVSLVTIVGILAVKSFLPPLVPLFYGKPAGVEQLASTWMIIIVPAISVLITIINLFISTAVKDEFVQKIVAVSAFVISVMSGITVAKIVTLVGFF